jgi:hypothetical protein
MKIVLDQPIAVSVEAAQAAFIDPAFYQSLGALSGISAPEVRSFSQNADHATLVVGYRFVGELNGPAKRLLDPGKITWSQVTDVDLATRRSEVRMVPDNYQGLLSFSGWYELRSEGPDQCSQHFEGDLRIRLPLLGPLAERAIGGSIRQNLAETARLVEQYATGEAKTGEAKTGEAKTGEAKTGEAKTGGGPETGADAEDPSHDPGG